MEFVMFLLGVITTLVGVTILGMHVNEKDIERQGVPTSEDVPPIYQVYVELLEGRWAVFKAENNLFIGYFKDSEEFLEIVGARTEGGLVNVLENDFTERFVLEILDGNR